MNSFTSMLALLLATYSISLSVAIPTPQQTETQSISPSASSTPAPKPTTMSSTSLSSTSSPIPTIESGEYYPPRPNGLSYNTEPTVDTSTGYNDGKSFAFSGLSVTARLSIIAAIITAAVAVFLITVAYYYRRKRQWEMEMRKRVAERAATASIGKKSLESFAEHGEIESEGPMTMTTTTSSSCSKPTTPVKSEFEDELVKGSVWTRWLLRK